MPVLKTIAQGSIIYLKGDKNRNIFLIKNGLVKFTLTSLGRFQNKDLIFKKDDVLGLYSSILNVNKDENAICIEKCEIIEFSLEEFKTLLLSNPAVGIKVLYQASAMLNELNSKNISIHSKVESSFNEENKIHEVALLFLENSHFKIGIHILQKFLQQFPKSPLLQDALSHLTKHQADSTVKNEAVEQKEGHSIVTLKKDNVLFAEGEMQNDFYILQDGEIEIIKVGAFKKLHSLATLTNGDFLGETAMLHNTPRSATAIVKSDTATLIRFNKNDFTQLFTLHPEFLFKFLLILAKRIWLRKTLLEISVAPSNDLKVILALKYLYQNNNRDHLGEENPRIENPIVELEEITALPETTIQNYLQHLNSVNVISYLPDMNAIYIKDISLFDKMIDSKENYKENEEN